MKCKTCGHEIPKGNKFCEYCGTLVVEQPKQKKCPSCGATVKEGENFCYACGTSLNKPNTTVKDYVVNKPKHKPLSNNNTSHSQSGKTTSVPKQENQYMKYGIIGGVSIILIAILIAVVVPSNTKTEKSGTTTPSNTSTMPERMETPKNSVNTTMPVYAINGISLEDSWSSVRKELGAPLSSSDEGIYTRYKYNNLEVVTDKNDVVQAVVTLTSDGATKGICVGDSFSDVVRQYGKDYSASDYDNLTLYEYSFDTPSGKPALFRFAVDKDSHKVSYMSARTLSDDVAKARRVFLDYHQDISSHDFSGAYSNLSQSMQANMGDVSSYSKGFKNTLSSNVSHLHVMSVTPSAITFAYELEAQDRGLGLSRQTQRFSGTVAMVLENGQWKIGEMEANKIMSCRCYLLTQ